jgi:ATP-dependent DNA helicase RecQ
MTTHEALHQYFGYNGFRHEQEAIINNVIKQQDTLVLMPTGGGKSICYQLPAVMFDGLTVVISPLIALMKDQVDALNINGIKAAFLNSSQNDGEQRVLIQQLRDNQIKLLYLAPERLFSSESRLIDFLKTLKVSLIAIDEAHCISHWGHDFRAEYLMLAGLKIAFPNIPVIALTATADKITRQDILDKLNLHDPAIFISSFDRHNINYRVASKKKSFDQLLDFLDDHKDDSGIIYCLSRQSTEKLAQDLRDEGYAAKAYHAGLSREVKDKNQEDFLRDEVKIIVATIAFGMGINKSNVRYVVHMDLPKNVEGYYQETGRAGRDGLPSEALLFFSYGDAEKLKGFAKVEGNEEQSKIMLKKLDDMVRFCQLQTCRRQFLLKYFDEQAPADCGACDVCLSEVEKIDGTVIAQKLFSAIARTNESFGMTYIIDFLRGSQSEKIREQHKQLKTYGIGADISKADWQQYIRELMGQDFLLIEGDPYPIMKLLPKASLVLKGQQEVLLTKAQILHERETPQFAPPYEAGLLTELKQVRMGIANEEDVPPYIILSDATLQEMATYLPHGLGELRQISGFGDVKLARYGNAFNTAVVNYCKQYNLESKLELKSPKRERRVKTTTTKPKPTGPNSTQQETFALYKAGMGVDEIAKVRSYAVTTIEGHLCTFVKSGQIDVSEFVAAAKIPAIKNAIESYGDEKLSPLKEVLGEKYSYTEIRAVVAWLQGMKEK